MNEPTPTCADTDLMCDGFLDWFLGRKFSILGAQWKIRGMMKAKISGLTGK